MNEEQKNRGLSRGQAWRKRIFYIVVAVLVFIAVPFILDTVGYAVAGGDWTSFTQTWFGQQMAAVTFLAGFAATVIIIAVIMYLILSAFETTEGGW